MPPMLVLSLVSSSAIYLGGHWLAYASRAITLAALTALWLAFGLVIRDFAVAGTLIYAQGALFFSVDGLSVLVTFIILSLSTVVTLYSGPDIRGQPGEEKYYAMLVLMAGAVIGLVSAGDLFNLWVWFELTAISSYLLVAFYREQTDALAASAKYLIQTATGSIFVLFGIALVFAQSGTLDLVLIQMAPSPLTIVIGTLFIIGFGVKIALVPTYTWLPDAYAQAPSGVSALLSGVVTISGLVAMLRALALLDGLTLSWGAVLVGFGMLNIAVGNILALKQEEVKRIFAYSSISHIGFILLAVGIGIYSSQSAGFHSGMLHLFTHALMKALAFLAVGSVIYVYGRANAPLRLTALAGIAAREPLIAVALVIACLSLAGVPPLAGFMSKWQIFEAGIETDNATLTILTVFAALNSVFSLAYYLPIINALFQPETRPPQRTLPTAMRIPIFVLTGSIVLIGLYPPLLDGLISPATQALTILFGGGT